MLPSSTNSAGSFDVATDGVLVSGKSAKGETLIWTTSDLWAARYIGEPFYYQFDRQGRSCGIISDKAAVILDSGAYWMGPGKKFFHYDQYVKPLECDVADYIAGSFNEALAGRIWVLANPQFGEITWFYPSSDATTANPTDRYVTFNYEEGHWSYGTMSRSIGVSSQPGLTTTPVLIGPDGKIYDHESGNAGRTGVFLESGPMKIGQGDQLVRVQRVVPDDKTLGDVNFTLFGSMFPDAAEASQGPLTLADPTSVRMTARQYRIRLDEVAATSWRVGVVQLGGILSGRRAGTGAFTPPAYTPPATAGHEYFTSTYFPTPLFGVMRVF